LEAIIGGENGIETLRAGRDSVKRFVRRLHLANTLATIAEVGE
jgi:hypothetical protein